MNGPGTYVARTLFDVLTAKDAAGLPRAMSVNAPRCDSCRFYRGAGARGVCTTADIEAWAEAGEWVEVEAQLWVAPDHYCAEWRPW